MEQEPLEEIKSVRDLNSVVHQMFADVMKHRTLTRSWRLNVQLLTAMALDRVMEALVYSAKIRHLKLEWSVSGGVFTPVRTITAKVSVVDEVKASKWGLKEAITSHFGDRLTGSKFTEQDDVFLIEGTLPFKHHNELNKYLTKLRSDMRKCGEDIDYEYSSELQEAPVKFALKIKTKPADKVEYKQLESNSAADLVDMVEWAECGDASTIQGFAEAAAKASYAKNGCLVLSTGKSNILVEVGEWVVKINGKLTGVISDEFKKHICGE